MTATGVLDDFPDTTQNPLLPLQGFTDFCCKRFRSASPWGLRDKLRQAAEAGSLRPLVVRENHLFYSPFQIWQVQMLARGDTPGFVNERILGFEPILRLTSRMQDYYLPEARGNRRYGRWHDYHGALVLDGYWRQTLTCLLSTLRRLRNEALLDGRLKPALLLEEAGVTPAELAEWQFEIHFAATSIDPLDAWHDLVASVDYEQRQHLRLEALLAQDYYEMVEVLRLFSVDAGLSSPVPEFTDPTDCSPRDPETGLPAWKIEKYGPLPWKPTAQLEFVANEYDLNPRPRAIVLTEGDEWQSIAELFRFYEFDPDLLGIELRSIQGVGNFTLSNWQVFIEYMHEKGVLVFFAIDSEGKSAQQARRLLAQPRMFPSAGLERVIPSEDRICRWRTSFEEDNFTDSEIAYAFSRLGVSCCEDEVRSARATRTASGLIERLFESIGSSTSKPELCKVLVSDLITKRRREPNGEKRPIENFVEQVGKLTIFNHQPSHAGTVELNRKSNYFG